jgi:MurNAc alpha-1-phosphate uridylyltransferase
VNEVASVVLCAGEGRRLRPITERLPKALCTVANRSLVRWALDSPIARNLRRAANAHHHAEQLAEHLRDLDVTVSVEQPHALGTAGAIGHLAPWLDGAHALVHNADAWIPDPPEDFVTGWDRACPRLLVRRTDAPSDFGPFKFLGLSLLPHSDIGRLRAEPTGLYEVVWRDAWRRGELELVEHDGVAFDVGTPERLLAANLTAGRGRSFVHPTAEVRAHLDSCVALPGALVPEGEEASFCVLGPGTLRVSCDEEVVRQEQAIGRGRHPLAHGDAVNHAVRRQLLRPGLDGDGYEPVDVALDDGGL